MNKQLIDSIIDKIQEHDHIALYRHVHADPDAYGAQVGLKEIIEETFPGKKVVLCGKHEKRLEYIGKMDENVQVNEKTLAIILDVGGAHRVDDASFAKCGYRLKIDHHRAFEEPFEDLGWVDTSYPSCCNMIVDLYNNSTHPLKLTKKAKEALYAGVVGDTGRFLFLKDPTECFKSLATITEGIDTKPIYEELYKREAKELRFIGYIYQNFEIKDGIVGYLKITKEVLEQYEIDCMKAVRMVNMLRDCEGLLTYHLFAESPESGEVMCEFRSKGPKVNEVAFKYGGGGHDLAAGATVANWNIVDEMIEEFRVVSRQYVDQR